MCNVHWALKPSIYSYLQGKCNCKWMCGAHALCLQQQQQLLTCVRCVSCEPSSLSLPLSPCLTPAYLVLPLLAAAVSECQLVWQRLELMLVGRVKRKMMQITRRRNTFPPFCLLPFPCSAACENGISSAAVMEQVGGGEGVGGWTTVFVVCCKKLFKLFGAAQTRLEKIKSERFSYRFSWLASWQVDASAASDSMKLYISYIAVVYMPVFACVCACVCVLCLAIWQPLLRIGLADVGRFLA